MHVHRVQEISSPLLHKRGEKRARETESKAAKPKDIATQRSDGRQASGGKWGSCHGGRTKLLGDMDEKLDRPVTRIRLEGLVTFDEKRGHGGREETRLWYLVSVFQDAMRMERTKISIPSMSPFQLSTSPLSYLSASPI